MGGLTITQIITILIGLFVIAPGLLYLLVKAFLRAKNEEKLEYIKRIKGGFNGQEEKK